MTTTNVIPLRRPTHALESSTPNCIGAHAHGLMFSEHNKRSPLLFPVDVRALYYNETKSSTETRRKCETHKLLIRDDTKQPLAVVGLDYATLPNAELFYNIECRMLDTLPASAFDNLVVRDRTSYNGRDCLREYCFTSTDTVIDDKSHMHFRIVVVNSYGATAFKCFSGFIDAYCSNGMIVGDYASIVRRHTKGLTLDGVVEYIDAQLRTYASWTNEFTKWARIDVDAATVRQVCDSLVKRGVMPKRAADKIVNDFSLRESLDHGRTVWAFVSAMTYWSTHESVRTTGNDHAAVTQLDRQLTVNDWLKSVEFRKIAA